MFDHVSIKVNDLEKSKVFYEKTFAPLGYKFSFGKDGIFYAFDIGSHCLFEIVKHNDNSPITGVHIAFRVENKEKVIAFHQAAIEAGATDHGKPGPRPQYTENYYASFILDLDGHNIEAMCDISI
jgi:catechol 2,3-dioxygenase-like lactoylglutathione lyase family enzyme